MESNNLDKNPFAPVRTGSPVLSDWLTVNEAVLHCTERGLPRTPKTIRKWASRSNTNPESADISVRQEDCSNGFRWLIEAASLERKIDEELTFEAQNQGEPVHTSSHQSEPVLSQETAKDINEPAPHQGEQVRTSANQVAPVPGVETELRAQLEQAYEEVKFLREELTHRRSTDKALGDVIEAFRLNSETSNVKRLEVEREPTRPTWTHTPRHDIVQNDEDPFAA